MSKCPEGTICFTHGIFVILIIVVVGIVYVYFQFRNQQQQVSSKIHDLKYELNNQKLENNTDSAKSRVSINSNKFIDYHANENQISEKPLYIVNKTYERAVNPFLAPLRSSPDQPTTSISLQGLGVPINIPTRGYSSDYQQVGLLTGGEQILPLYGKLTFPRSNKWLYYTGTDKYHMIKIPVSHKSRDCTAEYGCDELYDGDMVHVPAYNKDYKVSVYQLDAPRYIPYV